MTRRSSSAAAEQPIAPAIIRSIEPIDLPDFLRRYARAIVEAKGSGPAASAPSTASTTASTEAA